MIHKKEIVFPYIEYITDYIECDICKVKYHKNIIEEDGSVDQEKFYEECKANNMIHLHKSFGYGSKIGDEDYIEMDICEECFIKAFGLETLLSCIKEE